MSILAAWATCSATRRRTRAHAVAPLPQRVRPRTLDELVGQKERPRPRHGAPPGDRGGPRAVDDPPRPAGRRQDDDRADRRRGVVGGVRGALRRLRPRGRRSRRARPRARPARRQRRPDAPLHRRDPPLRQAAAGLGPPRGRGRAGDADRGDDREPVLRGQPGAPLALHRDRARAAHARGARPGARARCRRRSARPCPPTSPPRSRAVPEATPGPRSRRSSSRGRPRRQPARSSRSRTSRTPRASGRCATTAPATATTTSRRRSSSRCGAAIPTRRSTTSRRCSKAARIRASSRAAS